MTHWHRTSVAFDIGVEERYSFSRYVNNDVDSSYNVVAYNYCPSSKMDIFFLDERERE